MSEHGYCDKCGKDLGDHPTVNVEGINTLALCQERAVKWQRVEPGTVIPAGQPYRVEYPEMLPECLASDTLGILAVDYDGLNLPFKPFQRSNFVETSRWFVDSSWKPPQCLAKHPSNDSVIPCQLSPDHEGDHYSTSGCAGGGFHWPPLVLPTEPTWGIVLSKNADRKDGHTFDLGRWAVYGDEEWSPLERTHRSQFDTPCDVLSRENIADFIELTPEQVQRIEAAR